MKWTCALVRASGEVSPIDVDLADGHALADLVAEGGRIEVLRVPMPAGRLIVDFDAGVRQRPINSWATSLACRQVRGDALFASEADFLAAHRKG